MVFGRTSLAVVNPLNNFRLHCYNSHCCLSPAASLTFYRYLTINSITLINEAHLRRVCTILYQQQNTTESRLHSNLKACDFNLSHEFFLQVCNKFPISWRPVYRFFQYTEANPVFSHTPVSFNKMLDVIGKSKNIDLFWDVMQEMGRRHLVNDNTFRIAAKTFASARQLKKCPALFHLMNDNGYVYSLQILNKVVETLCRCKLAAEANFIISRLKEWIKPNDFTYRCLITGYCDTGDLIEASKVWNLMVDEGLQPDIESAQKMMETLFKIHRHDEAMKLFEMMRLKRTNDLGLSTYRLVIKWVCCRGMISQAKALYDEMCQKGILADNLTLGYLIYGLLLKGRVREAYGIAEGCYDPDISIYHGLIKGLLRLKRTAEATQVFREMIKRGCEPTMHTFVMLLQGHLGKRGRKGKDPLINFDTIFVGGLIKFGKSLEATKFVERTMNRGLEVPRFDYNKFLHYNSTEEGVFVFEKMGAKFREIGLFDLADILEIYGEKMATRDRRRKRGQVSRLNRCG